MKISRETQDALNAAAKDGRVAVGPAAKLPGDAAAMSEKEFQQKVLLLARAHGYRCYHTFDSRRSAAGYPDLTLVRARDGRLIFAELKTETGKLTPEQEDWLADLRAADVQACVWRPSQLPSIENLLR